ncbi:MAG: AAA family ATPase [bacterium]
MYDDFFDFNRKPFNVTPDPDFIYYSDQHSEALEQMLYGVRERRGFVLVTGSVGSGKTTLCRTLMRELDDDTRTAMVLNSKMGPTELLTTIAEDLEVSLPSNPSRKDVLDSLTDFLQSEYEAGRNVCLIVDEAQNLSTEALEQLRLLSNQETEKAKLIQIVLSGQPELEQMLEQTELRQLGQRIAVRCELSNLTEEETREYFKHRIDYASSESTEIEIDPEIYTHVFEQTNGNPRGINLLADRILLSAYVDESHRLEHKHFESAIDDLVADLPASGVDGGSGFNRLLIDNSSDEENEDESDEETVDSVQWPGLLKSPAVTGFAVAVLTIGVGLVGLSMFSTASIEPTIHVSETDNPPVDSVKTDTSNPGTVSADTATEPQLQAMGKDSKSGNREGTPTVTSEGTLKPEDTSTKPDSTELDSLSTSGTQAESPETVVANQDPGEELLPTAQVTDTSSGASGAEQKFKTLNAFRVNQPDPDRLRRGNTLNASLVACLARYLSYYSAKNGIAVKINDDTAFQFDLTASGEDLLGEGLSAQALPITGSAEELLRFDLPVFLRVQQNGPERYVLVLPERNTLWDPMNKSLERLPSNWKGFGFVLGDASFDMTKLMEYGLISSEVTELQKLLNGAGQYSIPTNGRFGPLTEKSLEDFQRRTGLPVDGVGGPATYLALLKANNRDVTIEPGEIGRIMAAISREVNNVSDRGGLE